MNPIDRIRWQRTLRTPSSERWLGMLEGRDAVALDVHFLPDGTAAGTVTVVEGGGIDAQSVPGLLERFDDDFLPGIDLDEGGVSLTVVFARSAEQYERARTDASARA